MKRGFWKEIKANIYPNPNNGTFNLQIDEEIKNAELILFNSLGQRVYEQTVINGLNNINTITTQLEDL